MNLEKAFSAFLAVAACGPDINVERPDPSQSISAVAAKDLIDLSASVGHDMSCMEVRRAVRRMALNHVDDPEAEAREGGNEGLLNDGVTRVHMLTRVEKNEDGTRDMKVTFRRDDGRPIVAGEFTGTVSFFCYDEVPPDAGIADAAP